MSDTDHTQTGGNSYASGSHAPARGGGRGMALPRPSAAPDRRSAPRDALHVMCRETPHYPRARAKAGLLMRPTHQDATPIEPRSTRQLRSAPDAEFAENDRRAVARGFVQTVSDIGRASVLLRAYRLSCPVTCPLRRARLGSCPPRSPRPASLSSRPPRAPVRLSRRPHARDAPTLAPLSLAVRSCPAL